MGWVELQDECWGSLVTRSSDVGGRWMRRKLGEDGVWSTVVGMGWEMRDDGGFGGGGACGECCCRLRYLVLGVHVCLTGDCRRADAISTAAGQLTSPSPSPSHMLRSASTHPEVFTPCIPNPTTSRIPHAAGTASKCISSPPPLPDSANDQCTDIAGPSYGYRRLLV